MSELDPRDAQAWIVVGGRQIPVVEPPGPPTAPAPTAPPDTPASPRVGGPQGPKHPPRPPDGPATERTVVHPRGGGTGRVAVGGAGPAAPSAVAGRYLPALDGLRALAVAGVLAYHLGLRWARGGYLGVDLFFVLSGFLITSLLVEEWTTTGRIHLGAFWARRARRLLPALFLLLVALAAFVVLNGRLGSAATRAPIDLASLRGDALATLFYVANWHAIFAHQSYFAQFSSPSPLEHTWSLAIEEQFYLLWPLVLLFVLGRGSRRSGGASCGPSAGPEGGGRKAQRWRRTGLGVAVAGTVGSALAMAVLYHPQGDPTRVYFGTDTRLFDLLGGVALAMVAAARPQPGARVQRRLHLAAPVALVALMAVWVLGGTAGGLPTTVMFRGGFLACTALSVVVVADARLLVPGALGRVLAVRPLRALGKISYGVYLWHWPIFVYMTGARTGLSTGWLDVARVGTTLAVSTLSYVVVERPLRRVRLAGWRRFVLAPVGATVAAAAILVATVPALAAPSGPRQVISAPPSNAGSGVPGAGGFSDQVPVTLGPGRVVSPAHPLRVMLLGDSVMWTAAPGIAAALEATGEVAVVNHALPGFGLSTAKNWRTEIPALIAQARPDIIVATWSWDNDWALSDPGQYRSVLAQAVDLMLTPGNGVAGVLFTQFPATGPVYAQTLADQQRQDAQRAAGEAAWARIVASLPAAYPGRVMYLPVASSVLLDGKFTSWLPPTGDPSAPRSSWVRVRMVDAVHLCPSGVVRYADALMADLTSLYRLDAARAGWWNGSWADDARYTAPGSCPADHPPG